MVRRNNASTPQGILRRPRVNALIRDGLEHPLLVILAGPGYGKTLAMSDYLAASKTDALWLRLTALDNLPTHFWNHMVQTCKPGFPDLACCMQALGFPDTLSRFDAFIQLLVKHNAESRQKIWVFDDFGVINNDQIKFFFRTMAEMALEPFRLVLISNELASTESIAFLSSKRFLVLGKDLRFTPDEIADLYQLHGLPLTQDELGAIERHTEGWALALRLLVQHRNTAPNTRLLDELTITHMFEERFFLAYPKSQQTTLIRLSLLNHFTIELVIDLYDGDPADTETLGSHPFFISEHGTGRLFFHRLYHLFLQKKQYLLTDADKQNVWKTAARYYAAAGEALEAIACYRHGGDHVRMLQTIGLFAGKLYGITEQEAAFLLEHLDLLTPQEVQDYPVADYFRAHLYMDILELGKAETVLFNLEKRLLDRGREDETTLLGDTYIALGFLHMIYNQENYGEFFQKADPYLPNGASYYKHNTLAIENNSCFAMSDNLPGARERMEQAAYRAAPWINKVLHGCMSGMEHIISAESAFMIGEFERARQQAYQGIYKAEANNQHDYACNGYFVLARIAWLQGELPEMTKQTQSIAAYADKYEIPVLKEIRDTVLTWYYLKLHDFNRIPKTIITMDHSNRPLAICGRPQVMYAKYLTAREEYAQLVGMLEHPRGLFLADGIWHDRIYLFILLAIGHQGLGNSERAMKAFQVAYDMCYHNNLTTLFIESGEPVRTLIHAARKQRQYDFDLDWLDLIDDKTSTFVKRAVAVRAEYRNRHPQQTSKSNPLSKREKTVLQALAQGLTREEIALKQHISVNTVKAAIRSIYNKLDANNRAEAVSIAIAHQYIEGYLPKPSYQMQSDKNRDRTSDLRSPPYLI